MPEENTISYEQMQSVYEKFLQRKSVMVEGEWYLFEREDMPPRIHRLLSTGYLEGCGPYASLESMKNWGWSITSLLIFRQNKVA